MRYELKMLAFVITGNACFEATMQTNLALLMILKALGLIMQFEFYISAFAIKSYFWYLFPRVGVDYAIRILISAFVMKKCVEFMNIQNKPS